MANGRFFRRGERSSPERGGDRGLFMRGDYGGRYGRDYEHGAEESREEGRFAAPPYGGVSPEMGAHDYSEGEHRGKGPRNAQRSDARVREDVCERLTDDPYVDASDLEVTVSGCEVTLSGAVCSRSEKRRAEDVAAGVAGVNEVHNHLRIARAGPAETERAPRY